MNVVFITLSRIRSIAGRGIYTDLMRKFRDEGHNVYIVTPCERRFNLPTSLTEIDGVHILEVKTLNIQKTHVVEKGFATILLESQLTRAVNKYISNIQFDLILYSTPPITFVNVITALKKKNSKAKTYLLLKDIFPQNAVDLQMFSKNSLFYKFFRKKEKKLYQISDFIGCMSPANVDFLLKDNPEVPSEKVEVAPNSIEVVKTINNVSRDEIRTKYHLPLDKPIFIYGGNLGKPQGIDYLIQCMEANYKRTDCHFLIVGGGTEFNKLAAWYKNKTQSGCVTVFSSLPKEDYDALVSSCDVGLIFLDHRFTIPNFPSRLLSYLEYKMPIIAATDRSTDIGKIAEDNGFGYWCESNDVNSFSKCVNEYLRDVSQIKIKGEVAYQYLINHYLTKHTYKTITDHIL